MLWQHLSEILKEFGGYTFDMESFMAGEISYAYHLAFLNVRCPTDTGEDGAKSDFEAMLPRASYSAALFAYWLVCCC